MIYLKIFRGVWIVSLLAVMGTLLYAYASLPELVTVQEEGTNILNITRDNFFYIVLGLLTIINVLVFTIARISVNNIAFRTWFYGLIITFNAFFIIGISYIALYNSGEAYDYQRLEVIIYGSIGMFSVWTVAWPIYQGYKLIFKKS